MNKIEVRALPLRLDRDLVVELCDKTLNGLRLQGSLTIPVDGVARSVGEVLDPVGQVGLADAPVRVEVAPLDPTAKFRIGAVNDDAAFKKIDCEGFKTGGIQITVPNSRQMPAEREICPEQASSGNQRRGRRPPAPLSPVSLK